MVFQHGEPVGRPDRRRRGRALGRDRAARSRPSTGSTSTPSSPTTRARSARSLAGRERPSGAAVRRLAREPRQILDIPRTIGITEIQRRVASILDEVGEGRPTAIYSSGKYVGVFITPAEYYRLRKLSRVVAWFRTAGLDLATADVARDRRLRPPVPRGARNRRRIGRRLRTGLDASARPRLRRRLSAAYRGLSCDSPAAHLGRPGRSPLTPCRRAPRRPWRRSPR